MHVGRSFVAFCCVGRDEPPLRCHLCSSYPEADSGYLAVSDFKGALLGRLVASSLRVARSQSSSPTDSGVARAQPPQQSTLGLVNDN
jgi:hypothetical protein